jgi:hypothetical protein
MLSGEEWKYDDPPVYETETHGEFGGRLSRGVPATTEGLGYTMWHLLAAKLLPHDTQLEFLGNASQSDVTADMLIDDIREGMTIFPHYRRTEKYTATAWADLVRRTAFRSPFEICEELGVPLILWEDNFQFSGKLHPVILAAQKESCARIGWPLDEVL